jgi:ABC-2 type transport system permease protein
LWAVYRREAAAAFTSPVAYAIIAIFLLVAGYFFYTLAYIYGVESFDKMRTADILGPQELTLGEQAIRPLFNNLGVILLMLMPIVTMRLFAEEKRAGSMEMLFTWPLTDVEIALGKYLAAVTVYVVMLLATAPFTIYLSFFADPPYAHILAAYLGLFLMGGAFIAFGTFVSTTTENQVVAAAVTFGGLLLFWAIAWTVGDKTGAVAETIKYLSIIEHLDLFAKGIVDSRDVVYYLSFIFLFLFLTLRSLESKGWRG